MLCTYSYSKMITSPLTPEVVEYLNKIREKIMVLTFIKEVRNALDKFKEIETSPAFANEKETIASLKAQTEEGFWASEKARTEAQRMVNKLTDEKAELERDVKLLRYRNRVRLDATKMLFKMMTSARTHREKTLIAEQAIELFDKETDSIDERITYDNGLPF